jgi:hypothetical protein
MAFQIGPSHISVVIGLTRADVSAYHADYAIVCADEASRRWSVDKGARDVSSLSE